MSSLIELDHVGYQIHQHILFDDISLKIEEGQILSLIGYNGSGKSTLLKILLGAIQPTTGNVYRRPKLRLGYVPQSTSMKRPLPLVVRDFFGIYGIDDEMQARLADTYDLHDLLSRPLHALSGGQLQRVLIAQALAHEPDLILMDEPTAGLDISAQEEFYDLIEVVMSRPGRALVMVSHDIRTVYAHADVVICLHDGICCIGSPRDQHVSADIHRMFGEHVLPYHHHHHD